MNAALVLILVLILPVILSEYGIYLTTEIFIMAIFAMSLGLIMGYAGLVSLGHAAFFGIGAYTVAIGGQYVPNTYLLLVLALLFAGALALLSGMLFIRVSEFYFLMITLAFGQLLYAIIWQLKSVTGGADGLQIYTPFNFGWGEIIDPYHMYYVIAVLFTLCYLFLKLFVMSSAGKAVQGVMENESRMKAMGYNIAAYKLLAYTIAGAMAGISGGLYSYYNLFVSPEMVSWIFSGTILIMVIVGGKGTLLGPALGAAFFIILQNYVSAYTERWPLIMGAIFIVFVLLKRGGIIHLLMDLYKKILPSRNSKRKLESKGENHELIKSNGAS